jgi:hypothetical protein
LLNLQNKVLAAFGAIFSQQHQVTLPTEQLTFFQKKKKKQILFLSFEKSLGSVFDFDKAV